MGYDTFSSLDEVLAAYKRARTEKHFIIEDGSNWNPTCHCCKKSVFDFSGKDADGKELHPSGYRSNRCVYNPKTKKIRAMHYVCAWTGTLSTIASLRRS